MKFSIQSFFSVKIGEILRHDKEFFKKIGSSLCVLVEEQGEEKILTPIGAYINIDAARIVGKVV